MRNRISFAAQGISRLSLKYAKLHDAIFGRLVSNSIGKNLSFNSLSGLFQFFEKNRKSRQQYLQIWYELASYSSLFAMKLMLAISKILMKRKQVLVNFSWLFLRQLSQFQRSFQKYGSRDTDDSKKASRKQLVKTSKRKNCRNAFRPKSRSGKLVASYSKFSLRSSAFLVMYYKEK